MRSSRRRDRPGDRDADPWRGWKAGRSAARYRRSRPRRDPNDCGSGCARRPMDRCRARSRGPPSAAGLCLEHKPIEDEEDDDRPTRRPPPGGEFGGKGVVRAGTRRRTGRRATEQRTIAGASRIDARGARSHVCETRPVSASRTGSVARPVRQRRNHDEDDDGSRHCHRRAQDLEGADDDDDHRRTVCIFRERRTVDRPTSDERPAGTRSMPAAAPPAQLSTRPSPPVVPVRRASEPRKAPEHSGPAAPRNDGGHRHRLLSRIHLQAAPAFHDNFKQSFPSPSVPPLTGPGSLSTRWRWHRSRPITLACHAEPNAPSAPPAAPVLAGPIFRASQRRRTIEVHQLRCGHRRPLDRRGSGRLPRCDEWKTE